MRQLRLDRLSGALDLGFPVLENAAAARPGAAYLIGGAASLAGAPSGLIEAGTSLIAVNGAHDYLLNRGITPAFCVVHQESLRDPEPDTPQPGTTYLLSATLPKAFLERFDPEQSRLWHPWYSPVDAETLAGESRPWMMIRGGRTAGLRALDIAHILGFREIHVVGFDSSFKDDTHAYPTTDGAEAITVEIGGTTFRTTPGLLNQAYQFDASCRTLAKAGTRVVCRSGGLLGHVQALSEANRVAREVLPETGRRLAELAWERPARGTA